MPAPHCTIGRLLHQLDDATRQQVDTLIRDPQARDTHGVPTDPQVARVITDLAGAVGSPMRVHRQTVGTHRRGQCVCTPVAEGGP